MPDAYDDIATVATTPAPPPVLAVPPTPVPTAPAYSPQEQTFLAQSQLPADAAPFRNSDGTLGGYQSPSQGMGTFVGAPSAAPAAPDPATAAPAVPQAADPYGDIATPAAPTPATPAGPDTRPTSQGLGFAEGITKPLDNVATWINNIPGVRPVDKWIANSLGMPSTDDAIATRKQAFADAEKTQKPDWWAKTAGEFAGTLPVAMLPGGILAQGAATGALTADNPNDPGQVALNAGLGAATGGLLHVGGSAVLNTIAPRIPQAAQALLNRGVPLTTDMMTGGKGPWGWLGKAASVTPVAGEMYRARGNEALAAFPRAFGNDVMSPISPNLPNAPMGELYQAARGAVDNAYGSVGNGAGVPLGGAYAARMQPVQQAVADLPADLQGRFGRVVGREIVGRVDPTTGQIGANDLMSAKSAINADIAKFPSPSGWDADYVDALKGTRRALTDSLGDTSPAAQAQLSAADAAYPGFKTFERAARAANQNSTTLDAGFTPQQALSAVVHNSSPSAVAAGTAPGQRFAQAAKDILPRKHKDIMGLGSSAMEALVAAGVGGSELLHNAGPALLAPTALAPLYSRWAQNGLRAGLSRTAAARNAVEGLLGPIDNYMAKGAGAAGGLLPNYYSPGNLGGLFGSVPQTQPSLAPAH